MQVVEGGGDGGEAEQQQQHGGQAEPGQRSPVSSRLRLLQYSLTIQIRSNIQMRKVLH